MSIDHRVRITGKVPTMTLTLTVLTVTGFFTALQFLVFSTSTA
jgi:hypothetical protein